MVTIDPGVSGFRFVISEGDGKRADPARRAA
jgi:hypothetical protein